MTEYRDGPRQRGHGAARAAAGQGRWTKGSRVCRACNRQRLQVGARGARGCVRACVSVRLLFNFLSIHRAPSVYSVQFLHSNIHVCPVFAFKYSRLSSFCIQIFTFALARTGTHTPTPNSGKQQSGYAASEWQADAAAKLAALCDDASATENAKKYASGALKLVAASVGKAPLVNKGLI